MRVLFLTTALPGARRTGGEVATQAFVDALRSAGHEVAVLGYRRTGDDSVVALGEVAVADRPIETSEAGLRAVGWMARGLVRRRPYSVAKYVSRAMRIAVERHLSAERPALVVVDHAQMGWLLPRGGFGVPHVHVAHNVEHALYAQLASRRGGPWSRVHAREATLIERIEHRLCESAAGVWALTLDDAQTLGALGGRSRAFALPATTGAGTYADDVMPEPACDVTVLGSWTWDANARGLRWLLDDVLPALPRPLSIEVAGAGSLELAGGHAGVVARGRVPDALEFLRRGRVVAVPSVEGAGVQVKTLDAIAAGRPVVASELALRGIDDPPATVLGAADAGSFARALAQAAGDPGMGAADEAARWTTARRERFVADVAAAADAAAGG